MIIKPKVSGLRCITTHPVGCFHDLLCSAAETALPTGEAGRLRLDDWDQGDDVQKPCKPLRLTGSTENLRQINVYGGYMHEFQLFGFDQADVDYDVRVEVLRQFDCLGSRN